MCKQLAQGCTRQHVGRHLNLQRTDCKSSTVTTQPLSHNTMTTQPQHPDLTTQPLTHSTLTTQPLVVKILQVDFASSELSQDTVTSGCL